MGRFLRFAATGCSRCRSDPGGALMTRRPSPSRRPPPNRSRPHFTAEELRELEKAANKGLSKRFLDNAFWLPHDVDEELIETLRAVERSSGKDKNKKLIELLLRRAAIPAYDPPDLYF